MKQSSLILASASPRRRQLLAQLGWRFRVMPANIDESRLPAEDALAYVRRLALSKARAIAAQQPGCWVLGVDTIVVRQDNLLGKPADEADFMAMMTLLSGNWHQVHTAMALVRDERTEVVSNTTEVKFIELTKAQMTAYWQSGEPADKAGGYGIQGYGGRFVEQIRGDYYAVMGLSLWQTADLLERCLQEEA